MDFPLFERGMAYSTLEPPTSADLLFIFTSFNSSGVTLSTKPSFSVVDCLQTGLYPEGPTMTIQKATIFININGFVINKNCLYRQISNYYYYFFFRINVNTPSRLIYYRLLHEIGHAIGLHENDDVTSVMYNNPTPSCLTNNTLKEADKKRINQLYFLKEQVAGFIREL